MDDIDDLLEDEMLFGSGADLPHGLRFILMHVLAHADLPRSSTMLQGKRPLTDAQPHHSLQAFANTGPFAKRLKAQPSTDSVQQTCRRSAAGGAPSQQAQQAQQANEYLGDDDFLMAIADQFEADEALPAAAKAAPTAEATSRPDHGLTCTQEEEIEALLRAAYAADNPGGSSGAEGISIADVDDAATAAALDASAGEAAYVKPSFEAHTLDGDVMPVTLETGLRAYCRVADFEPAAADQQHSARSAPAERLLSTPIAELMRQADEVQLRRALEAVDREERAAEGGKPAEEALWMDKYRPRTFLELLSDEAINRGVVRWLRSWDACVFGRRASGLADGAARKGGVSGGDNGGKSGAMNDWPEQRVLLMSGPPGLGKTTLAHVVARQCGYQPYEINASDDRTAKSLVSRIQDAAQMQSVLGSRKPNCIIVDEVDGTAGGGESKNAVQALLKLAYGGGAEGPGAAAGKRKQKPRQLCRPIICICNDLYASVLRPLRTRAAVFQFKQPTVDRLVSRMKLICSSERLGADRQALATLAEHASGDVRCCLNTLQFLARQRGAVRAADMAAACAGHKDVTSSAFAMWQQLLWLRGSKVARSESGPQRTARLLALLADFGEHELVTAGCHENMLSMRYRDAAMKKTAGMARGIGDTDLLHAAMRRTSDFSLLRFLPAATLAVTSVAAGPERVQLQWPQAGIEARRAQAANEAMLRAWVHDTSAPVLASLTAHTAAQHVLPALVHVLVPAMRPVAAHLQTDAERAALAELVDTMLAYNLCYEGGGGVAAAAAAGVSTALQPLQPPVDRLCNLEGVLQSRKQLSAAQQQVIVAALQAEVIRRRMAVRAQGMAAALVPSSGSEDAQATAKPSGVLPLTVAQRAKLTLKSGNVPGKARKVNWLEQLRTNKGRVGALKPACGTSGVPAKAPATVLFKFHEGYTNAVKRPVLMCELLGRAPVK